MNRLTASPLLVLAAVACGGGTGDPAGDDGGRGDGGSSTIDAGLRDCAVHFSHRPEGEVIQVAIAGQWGWDTHELLADDDGDGRYELAKELPPGLWAYKLVVTRPAGDEWLLDPENPYRTYVDGIENSAARVGDCTQPLVALESHQQLGLAGATFAIRFVSGATGAVHDPAALVVELDHGFTSSRLDAPSLAVDGAAIDLSLSDLAPGKYTLRISASDVLGRAAEPLLLPFWIEAEPFDWRGALIYMVMTDRFRNANPGNDPLATLGADVAADFHGGDLAGVTAAIEDGTFEALGVSALWLSPPVRNAETIHYESGHGVTAFHGYWPTRAREIDPRLGTDAELEALVTAAHARGIRILLDYVINHVHQDHEYVAAHPAWFRTGCECGSPGCDWTEHRLDCSFHDYMPDVNWQDAEAGEQMISDALWWLERFDLDGLRVDAVKHVEDAAITNLSTRIHERLETAGTEYFLLGETAMGWGGDDVGNSLGDYQTISRYIGPTALNGQFDFVLYHAASYRVFADRAKGMLHLDYWTRMSQEHYPADAIMTPFVGSHDSERLLSLATYGSSDPLVHHKWADQGLPAAPTTDAPYQRAALALTWLLSSPGAPLLYYGDEYGEFGGADPDNRHMWRSPGDRSAREAEVHTLVARAGRARRALAALRAGDYRPLDVTEDLLAFARVSGPDAALVVLNLGDAAITRTILVPEDVPLAGALHDHLAPAARPLVISGGSITLSLPARSAAILAPDAP